MSSSEGHGFSFRLSWLAALAALASGCVAAPMPGGSGPAAGICNGKCDNGVPFQHRWAIDMAKVRQVGKYRQQARFLAAVQQELQLPNDLWAANCSREQVIGARSGDTYAVTPGECLVWETMKLNYDHSAHVDDPARHPIVNIIDGDRHIDPPGYLNIIALKNAERHQQDEIRGALRNGDILVYFHPEDHDTTQYRMHHAAMYYDTGSGPLAISLNGTPFVHHIDNPVSYGPSFNAGVESVPFHVYRFNPNGAANVGGRNAEGRMVFPCTDEIRDAGGPAECRAGEASFTINDAQAEQYAYIARNWALLTNSHAPFANFHDMTWNDAWQRAQLGNTSILAEVDRYAAPAVAEGQTPQVYCAGLVFTNLNLALNRPMNADAMGSALWNTFSTNTYSFNDRYMSIGTSSGAARGELGLADLADTTGLPRMGRLVFEPTPASTIVDEWLENYYAFPALPEAQRRQAQAGILAQAAPQIVQGFRSLVWAATKDPSLRENNTTVATTERIQQYAMAYGAGGEALANIKQLELANIDNRYVPPPMYHWLANDASSLISYVGTVIHVDMLSPINGNDGNTGGGEVSEFSEGGPDTSLYEHYFVANGGRRIQRILPVSSGPQQIGGGTSITNRISAADVSDVRLVLHPAGTFDMATIMSSVYGCERNENCLPGIPGILLPVPANWSGAITDQSFTTDLFKPIAEGGAGCTIVGDVRSCPAYDYATGAASETQRVNLGNAYGHWTVAMIDLGQRTDGVQINNCASCATGGAHTNQWFLKIRNDATVTDPVDPPPPPVGMNRNYDAGAISVAIPDFQGAGSPMCGGDAVADAQRAKAAIDVADEFELAGGEVTATISHSYVSDLHVELRRDGQVVTVLQACAGGRGDGTLSLRANLANVQGNARGRWELVVGDYARQDEGTITAFRLSLGSR